MKYLIAGLGNIGPEYKNTRHNIGFDVLDQLAKEYSVEFQLEKQAYKATFKFKGRIFVMIKPTTYMNLSGKAIQHWMTSEKIPIDNLLVVTDDIALDIGKLRMKKKGSAGGHNGLKHIEQTLASSQYTRLRFGVGNDFPQGRQIEYVLGKFTEDEKIELSSLIDISCEMIISFAAIGADRTMNQFNK